MLEIILFCSYMACSFISVLIIKWSKNSFISKRLFWVTWLIGLVGASLGGLFGIILITRIGLGMKFILSILPGFLGAWLFSSLFIKLREIPGNW
ncbi:hypothetical protein S1OALGB6SA_1407 [Olavius algarvensis spirochete endosymbiont]|uniref:hypothetical protein n=1 Tax=Olavius algarvensis spirochete endosymbiont TaxID=260710 RepID=UPI00052D432D|nr:hypothetical protein [Olavius algarvensis spirochete endosymbiont]KGM43658.1 hypothetical protein JY97_05810 [Alkalispirochaeta odontotermitis]VDB00329.1 hypothetical protein S1OALGB6SA_1407 [Olavius algarvensis spirochete endosymbiont]